MPLNKLLDDLDKLNPEEKLQAIQYLTTGLLRKNAQTLASDSKQQNLPHVEMLKAQPQTEIASQPATSNSGMANREKKQSTREKPDTVDTISEVSPDGIRYFVNIPSHDMVREWAQTVWESLAPSPDAPPISDHGFVYECANFFHLMYEIEAKATIREKITGSRLPEKMSVETTKRKRKTIEQPEKKMIITKMGGGHYHVDYED